MCFLQFGESQPYLCDGYRGDEKIRGILSLMPRHKPRIRQWLGRFTDRVCVEHKPHSLICLIKSAGIRGGTQSVVSRTDSCHARNSRMVCLGRSRSPWTLLRVAPRFASQFNNWRASRGESFFTSRMAVSTALITKQGSAPPRLRQAHAFYRFGVLPHRLQAPGTEQRLSCASL